MPSSHGDGPPKPWASLRPSGEPARLPRTALLVAVLILAVPGCMTVAPKKPHGPDRTPAIRSRSPRAECPPDEARACAGRFPREAGGPGPGSGSRPRRRTARCEFGGRGLTGCVRGSASSANSGRRRFPIVIRQHAGQRRRWTTSGESCQPTTEWPEPDRAESPPARGRAGRGTAVQLSGRPCRPGKNLPRSIRHRRGARPFPLPLDHEPDLRGPLAAAEK